MLFSPIKNLKKLHMNFIKNIQIIISIIEIIIIDGRIKIPLKT